MDHCLWDALLVLVTIVFIFLALRFAITREGKAEIVAEKIRVIGHPSVVFGVLAISVVIGLFAPRWGKDGQNWCGQLITPESACEQKIKNAEANCIKKFERTAALAERYYYRSTPKYPKEDFLVTESNRKQAYMFIGDLRFTQNSNTGTGIDAYRRYIVEVINEKNKNGKIEIRPKKLDSTLEWTSPRNHVFSSPEVNEVVYRLETNPPHEKNEKQPKNMGYFIGKPEAESNRKINGKVTATRILGIMDYLMTNGKWISADKVLEMMETDPDGNKSDNPYIKAESIARWFKSQNSFNPDDLEKNYVFCELHPQNNCKKLSELVKN